MMINNNNKKIWWLMIWRKKINLLLTTTQHNTTWWRSSIITLLIIKFLFVVCFVAEVVLLCSSSEEARRRDVVNTMCTCACTLRAPPRILLSDERPEGRGATKKWQTQIFLVHHLGNRTTQPRCVCCANEALTYFVGVITVVFVEKYFATSAHLTAPVSKVTWIWSEFVYYVNQQPLKVLEIWR